MENRQRVTISDVAKLAGVSVSTAARVFNSGWSGNVKTASKEKVLAAAKELGYYGTNALAKSLNGSKTNIIAIITAEQLGSFYSKVVLELINAIKANGKQAMVFPVNPEVNSLTKIVAEVHQYCIDAAIVISPATYDVVRSFNTEDFPLVLFNRGTEDSNISAVYCDNFNVGRMAADFFMDQGLTQLGFLSGNNGPTVQMERLEGFTKRVQERGGVVTHVLDGNYTYASAVPLARQMLASSNRPEAVYCSEDSMAAAVIDVAQREFGLSIPQDLSVIGTDNTPLSEYLNYSITTFAHPLPEMLASTMEILDQLLESNTKQYERVYDMKLVIRDSVKLKT